MNCKILTIVCCRFSQLSLYNKAKTQVLTDLKLLKKSAKSEVWIFLGMNVNFFTWILAAMHLWLP